MDGVWKKKAKFLIVDHQVHNHALERILRQAGYSHLHCTTNPGQIERLCYEVQPDIIILNLHMPDVDGLAVLRRLREWIPKGHYLPILVLTADMTPDVKKEALHQGANDFLTKPLDKTEAVLRINNLLRTRYFYLQTQEQIQQFERHVASRTLEIEQAKQEILQVLGRTSEFRDDETGQHTVRVGQMAEEIAAELGLPPHEVALIKRATPLHDIGKIGIPDEILLKPGRFTPEEFERMKAHTTIGGSILEGSQFSVLQVARTIALSHHEKWDGTGYPNRLKGEEIPLEGRIVAIADFFDALTHERPYKRAWTEEEALDEIQKQRGLHFDPQVVDALFAVLQRKQRPIPDISPSLL